MKANQQKLEKMVNERLKLFCHMSPESMDEVGQVPDYDVWSKAIDPDKLWQAIVKTHKVDCVTSVDTMKE